jgi:hypothetical protein
MWTVQRVSKKARSVAFRSQKMNEPGVPPGAPGVPPGATSESRGDMADRSGRKANITARHPSNDDPSCRGPSWAEPPIPCADLRANHLHSAPLGRVLTISRLHSGLWPVTKEGEPRGRAPRRSEAPVYRIGATWSEDALIYRGTSAYKG